MNAALESGKRSPEQFEGDLVFIAERLLTKMPVAEIHRQLLSKRSAEYTLSLSQIYKDVRVLERRWASGLSATTITEWKAKELRHIEHLEEEALKAYERSKADGQTMSGTVNIEGSPTGSRNVTKTRRDGDPRWFDVLIKLMERKARLLGLDAPLKLDAIVKEEGGTTLDSLRQAYKSKMEAEVKASLRNGTIVDAEVVKEDKNPGAISS